MTPVKKRTKPSGKTVPILIDLPFDTYYCAKQMAEQEGADLHELIASRVTRGFTSDFLVGGVVPLTGKVLGVDARTKAEIVQLLKLIEKGTEMPLAETLGALRLDLLEFGGAVLGVRECEGKIDQFVRLNPSALTLVRRAHMPDEYWHACKGKTLEVLEHRDLVMVYRSDKGCLEDLGELLKRVCIRGLSDPMGLSHYDITGLEIEVTIKK